MTSGGVTSFAATIGNETIETSDVESRATLGFSEDINFPIKSGYRTMGYLKGYVEFKILPSGSVSITDTSGLYIQGSSTCWNNSITTRTAQAGNPAKLTFSTTQTCRYGNSSVATYPMSGLQLKVYPSGKVSFYNPQDIL